MASLREQLIGRIARFGPITVADYMADALTAPRGGYYMAGDPFGARGDFVTAPEISQMFGELLGLFCADTWERMGAPNRVLLVELGPGRGTLMADALRAARVVPQFLEAVDLHLVEVSPALAARQREALAGIGATWHHDFGSVPDGPMLLLANEFFDALPIRQFERSQEGWRERMVGLDADGRHLRFGLSPASTGFAAFVPPELRDAPDGKIVEVCPAGLSLAAEIARQLVAHGGAALIVDYGRSAAAGATLQAVRGHAPHGVLDDPGSADLTAHVDLPALARAGREAGAAAHGPVPQGAFLKRLGIDARAETLLKKASPEQARQVEAARRRLTDPQEMGELFQALALTHPALAPPAGFA